jgi:hypothetical protein
MEEKSMRTTLIGLGLFLLILGLLWPWLARAGFGHLPGDVRIVRPGFSLYVPFGSGLVISLVLTLLLNLIFWLWRR